MIHIRNNKSSLRNFRHILVTFLASKINHIIVISCTLCYRVHKFNNPLRLYAIIGFLYILDSKVMVLAIQKYFTDFH
jgi:hypothetical protein